MVANLVDRIGIIVPLPYSHTWRLCAERNGQV
jgi:hypothetical protein